MKISVDASPKFELQVETADHLDQIKAALEGLQKALEILKEERNGSGA